MYKMAAGQDEDEDDYTPRKQREDLMDMLTVKGSTRASPMRSTEL